MSLVHEVEDLSFLPPEGRQLTIKLRKWITSHFPGIKIEREEGINERGRKFYTCLYNLQGLYIELFVSDERGFSPFLVDYCEGGDRGVRFYIYRHAIGKSFKVFSFRHLIGRFSTIEAALTKLPLPI